MAIRVPRLSYEDVRGYADRFLGEHHPSLAAPVPIEEIVEFGLQINIIPIPGLQAVHDIDGFLSGDMKGISVDEYVFENRLARYRFTLAHEIAHLVIHGDRLREVTPKSIPDWKQFVRELPEGDYAWLEWQAYAFGGLVLAPRGPLLTAHDEAVQAAREAGIDPVANWTSHGTTLQAGLRGGSRSPRL